MDFLYQKYQWVRSFIHQLSAHKLLNIVTYLLTTQIL